MLVFRYVLRHIFRNEGKEAGRGTQYYYARASARASGSCKNEPENADFPAGKSRKKCENDENWEKNFFPRSGKNIKISLTERKKS